MRGLRLIWDPIKGQADLGVLNGALDTTHVLETMVIMSLFSDRRAEASDAFPFGSNLPPIDPRGWWGDSFPPVPNWKLGSRLWLLQGGRALPKLPLVARGFILESLAWMIEDNVAGAVDAKCWFDPQNRRKLDCRVTLAAPPANSPFLGIWRAALGLAANDNFNFANIVQLAA